MECPVLLTRTLYRSDHRVPDRCDSHYVGAHVSDALLMGDRMAGSPITPPAQSRHRQLGGILDPSCVVGVD